MADYKLTVGLEIHAELLTKTKMFCDSKNDTDEKTPNTNICPVCMGHPGTLPVINKEAVRSVLRLGTAIGGEIADYTEFDRKNYFYPDIPKGYQISQYKHPLVKGGNLSGVKITRVHLEEDTAKSSHEDPEFSLLDFNRAGVPLMELVTEPVIHDAETAGRFARELQLLLHYLGISHANMEKGEMRIEANISVSKGNELGTKVEVKNLNSFRSVEKAVEHEMKRQIELLEKGEDVKHETRGWDEDKEATFQQRSKEESHDYRYFPDPDLSKLFISDFPEFSEDSLLQSLPELPWQKRERLKNDYGIKDADIEIFVRDTEWGRYFEDVLDKIGDKKHSQLTANYINSELKSMLPSDRLARVMILVGESKISSRGAKDIIKALYENDADPQELAEQMNLIQNSDIESIAKLVDKVIEDNQNAVSEYKKGKISSLQYLIGQAMKMSKGSANPNVLREILESRIK